MPAAHNATAKTPAFLLYMTLSLSWPEVCVHRDRQTQSSRSPTYRITAAVQVKKLEKPALQELPVPPDLTGTSDAARLGSINGMHRTNWSNL
jgi:hypothetical protein